jgi:CRISPR system Cascade subunit CasA
MLPPKTFCLLDSPWLPVRRRSGDRSWIRPAEIGGRFRDDPIVAFDWQRADLDAAARELMIGLLSTACWRQVVDEDAWEAWWETPPDAATLDAFFAPLREAFLLDGPGPRFMQDRMELEGTAVPVAGLLIDTPGENALKRNTDLFVKRGRIEVLSREAAAMALFTLQDFAPSGGAGHRTSLRGGGPMLTLMLPGEGPSLWQALWLNVAWDEAWPDLSEAELPRIFPWLVPTRTSEKGAVTTPQDVHPAQAYWGMPRRIRLDFELAAEGRECDLTGKDDIVLVRSYRTRPWGINYGAWRHPSTPYYRQKLSDPEWLPVHPQPERPGYRHWVGLVVNDQGALRSRAAAVGQAVGRLPPAQRRDARLWAAGYDMDNMKPRGFVESEMPLHLFGGNWRDSYASVIQGRVDRAREAASLLGSAVRQALWGNEAPAADAGDRQLASERFWSRTETPFLEVLAGLAAALDGAEESAARAALAEADVAWSQTISRHALAIFDELVPMAGVEEQRTMERRIVARRRLFFGLREPAAAAGSKPKRRKAA